MSQTILTDVPETMLWTLHNRATEAKRADGILNDPEAVRIYDAIDYDYERSFGKAEPSHAVRSAMFDGAVRGFLEEHPDGVVVNLGEGLETQRFRVLEPARLWLSIDLPEAIDVRERFISADEGHKHVRVSALDQAWFDDVPEGAPLFVTAQGLFMYFEEREVQALLCAMAKRFPGATVMFDAIPRWISRMTIAPGGYKKTEHYTTPRMPWGINRNEVRPVLHRWIPNLVEVKVEPYRRFPRGFLQRWVFPAFAMTPVLKRYMPTVSTIRFGSAEQRVS